MKEPSKTKQELIEEIAALKKKIKKLEKSETSRKQAEDELRETEKHYRQLAEDMPAFICTFLPDSTLTYVNSAYCEIFQKRPDELVGQKFLNFLPDEAIRENVRCRYMSLTPENSVQTYEHKLIVSDGTGQYHWHRWTDRAFFNDKFEISHFQSIGQDITERKRVEEALRESETKLQAIFDKVGMGILIIDSDTQIITEANQAAIEMSGLPKKRIIGQICNSLVCPALAGKCPVKDLGRSIHQSERKLLHADGHQIDILKTIYPITIKGRNCYLESFIDISGRLQAEEALRESEKKYRLIAENTADVISILDLNLRFTYVSPAIMRLRGLTVEEAMEQTIEQFLTPESLRFGLAVFEKEMQLEASGTADPDRTRILEFEGYKKDGSIIWMEVNFFFLRNKERKPVEILMVSRDITDRKWAESQREAALEALAKSEEKFRKVFYTSPDVVSINRLEDGMYISINPGFTRIMEYTEKDIIGKTSIECNIWDNIEDRQRLIAGLKKDREVINLEAAFRTKGGEIRYGLVSASVIDLNGVPNLLGVVRDITDRKRAEDALRESEEKYRSILENIDEAYLELDLKGNIIFFSDSACRISGYSQSEIMGMNFRQYSSPETEKKLKASFNDIYKTGKKWSLNDFELVRKDKSTRSMEISVNLLRNLAGEAIGFRCISRDITERKRSEEEKRRLEERLQRSEKMEALGTLAGGVAHDLNNVLGVIVGYAELLLNETDKLSPIRPRLTKIMNGSEKAAAIVQDLLTLARRGVPVRQIINLNKIILDYQNSPELEKLSAYHSAVRIKLDLEAGLLNISGSSVHLGKALFNLVSNAAEAMPQGGDLTIKTANQYLDKPIYGYDEVREGDYVVLSVTDTGEGIPAKDLQRIFEPFYTKKVMGRSGTGLGLAVIWGTMKDHQGYINVQSAEGKGSTFTLYFPVTREDISVEAASISVSEYMGKGETILVVDDVKEQRELAEEMLKKLNYQVATVTSGEEAIAYIKEHKVDLLVLDMIMDPGMDGLATYKSIIQIHPKQRAIIVSGFSETERVNEAHVLGAGAYVKKPYVIEKLGMAVRKELDRDT